mgnify:CR=1 FL=1
MRKLLHLVCWCEYVVLPTSRHERVESTIRGYEVYKPVGQYHVPLLDLPNHNLLEPITRYQPIQRNVYLAEQSELPHYAGSFGLCAAGE